MEGFWKEKNYEVKIVNMYSSCERGIKEKNIHIQYSIRTENKQEILLKLS